MLQELAEQLFISFHNKVKHQPQGHGTRWCSLPCTITLKAKLAGENGTGEQLDQLPGRTAPVNIWTKELTKTH